MIPVDQTTVGDGSSGAEPGNCWSACLASLLELPLQEVPNFNAPSPEGWFERTRDWLAGRGHWLLLQTWPGDDGERSVPEEVWSSGYFAPGALVILCGRAERGFDHAVVARATASGPVVIHDPHPSRAGLLSYKDVSVVVPLNPARDIPRGSRV